MGYGHTSAAAGGIVSEPDQRFVDRMWVGGYAAGQVDPRHGSV